jgi:hypothetical protein
VRIELTREEALVIFEFLWREAQPGAAELRPQGTAELTAHFRLEGRLEPELWELLSPDFNKMLDAARASLSDDTAKPDQSI